MIAKIFSTSRFDLPAAYLRPETLYVAAQVGMRRNAPGVLETVLTAEEIFKDI